MSPEQHDRLQGARRGYWRRAARGVVFWISIISSLFGLSVGFVWVRELLTPRAFELVIWVKQATALYPSKATGNASLPFVIGTIEVRTASVVTVEIKNFGTSPIGDQRQLWALTFSPSDTAASIMVIGEPAASIPLAFHIDKQAPSMNLPIVIGLMESGARLDLRLLILNHSNPDRPTIKALCSLEGLPPPVLTWSAPNERLAAKLLPATIPAGFILSGLLWWQYDYKRDPHVFKSKRKTMSAALLIAILALFVGFISAQVMGWLWAQFI
jgi:hypothetical protein